MKRYVSLVMMDMHAHRHGQSLLYATIKNPLAGGGWEEIDVCSRPTLCEDYSSIRMAWNPAW